MTRYELDPKPIDIEWRTPTLPRRGGLPSRHLEFWDTLEENPGKWAVFRKDFKGGTGTYKKNHPGFEFITRTEYTCSECKAILNEGDRAYVGEFTCPNSCAENYLKKVRTCWARFVGDKGEQGEQSVGDIEGDDE